MPSENGFLSYKRPYFVNHIDPKLVVEDKRIEYQETMRGHEKVYKINISEAEVSIGSDTIVHGIQLFRCTTPLTFP